MSFDDVYKCLNVNYSAPWVDMVTFLNASTVTSFCLKRKKKKKKKNSHSFLNVHDSPTVLVHGPHAETHVMATTKNKTKKTPQGIKKMKRLHCYRSERLLTVSGTNTQRSKRTSVFQRNQGL